MFKSSLGEGGEMSVLCGGRDVIANRERRARYYQPEEMHLEHEMFMCSKMYGESIHG